MKPMPLEGFFVCRPPEEAELLHVAEDAAARGLYLVTDGRTTKLSPIVEPGWHRLAVRVKAAP